MTGRRSPSHLSRGRRAVRTAVIAVIVAVALALSPVATVSAAPAPTPAPPTYPFRIPGSGLYAVNAAGTTAYTLSGGDYGQGRALLRVIDVRTRRVAATVGLGMYVSDLVLDEPRHRAYVGHDTDSYGQGGGIWVVDLDNYRVQTVWPVPVAGSMVLSPDGSSLWTLSPVVEGVNDPATVIDPTSGKVVDQVLVGSLSRTPVFTPDGRKLYIENAGGAGQAMPSISVIDTATRTVIRTLSEDGDKDGTALTMDPTGSRLLVVSDYTGLSTFDTATDRLIATYPTLSGQFLFDDAGHVINVHGSTYQVLDATTFAPISPVQDAAGTSSGAARHGLLDLVTHSVREVGGTNAFSTAVTVTDPLQWITASTLPRQIVLSSPSTTIPFTVSQSKPQSPTTVALASPDAPAQPTPGGGRLAVTVLDPDADGRLSGSVTFPSRDSDLGPQIWTLSAGAATTVDVQATYVRARSLLGTAATRRGDLVDVIGSAKAWTSAGNTYVPSAGRPVLLQRYTSSGWQTLSVLTSDRLGHVATTRRFPFRVALRLLARDTATAATATSNQVVD